jgi:hypothetical protein
MVLSLNHYYLFPCSALTLIWLSSETPVKVYRTKRHQIPEELTLQKCQCFTFRQLPWHLFVFIAVQTYFGSNDFHLQYGLLNTCNTSLLYFVGSAVL